MAANIYKTVNGKQIKLSASQIKAETLRARGWTSEQYQKYYDILKNKLRAYEAFTRASGVTIETQSVAELIYYETKAMEKYGTDYTPSFKLQTIKAFTSISSGKALQKALQSDKYVKNRQLAYFVKVENQFGGLIAANEGAKMIWEARKPIEERDIDPSIIMEYKNTIADFQAKLANPSLSEDEHRTISNLLEQYKKRFKQITDPVKLEQALADYGRRINAKINNSRKAAQSEAIPISSYGGGSTETLEVEDIIQKYGEFI